MAEIRHACADGLTPECFAKYPQYAKKVFAYRLMHTMCPARMTTKLREALWKALIRVPVSWIPFDQFIFPDDFDWSLVFPDDWTPEDPVPSCVIVEPGAEFPADWRPGDELPPGVTIDLSKILPPDWKIRDPLPFGITVDPTYRIQIPQLKLMYIFIRPGETWESVFPNGWDPNGPLPDGASWNPYLVFPDYVPAIGPEQEAADRASKNGTTPPLYMGPWEPGPVHRPPDAAVAAEEVWFFDDFLTLDLDVWNNTSTNENTATVSSGILRLDAPNTPGHARIQRTDGRNQPTNVDLTFQMALSPGEKYGGINTYVGMRSLDVRFYEPTRVDIWTNAGDYTTYVLPFSVTSYHVYRFEQREGLGAFYQDDVLIAANIALETYGNYAVIMDLIAIAEGAMRVSYYKIEEK